MPRCFSVALAALLLTVLLASPAGAQITFDLDDLYDYGESGETVLGLSFSTAAEVPADDRARIDALIDLRGQGQTWDFTTITYPNRFDTRTTIYRDGDVSGQPGAANFSGANYALFNDEGRPDDDGDGYTYARVDNGQYVSLGAFKPAATSPSGTDEIALFEPGGLQQVTFPLSFGDVTTDQTVSQIDAGPAGVITTTTDYRSEVVGAGTLVTPSGSAEALMIEFRITVSVAGQSTTTNAYGWATRNPNIGATATNFSTPQGERAYVATYRADPSATNSAPTIPATQTARAPAGQTTTIDVLASASDPDGDALSIESVTDPANGTAEIGDDGTGRRRADIVRYTPDAGFVGEDSFDVTVTDGAASATGTVSVTVVNTTSAGEDPSVLTLAAVPNPASGRLQVRVASAQGGPARIAVYDLLGREAAVVWDGPLAAGERTFELDTAALAPGVYVARAQVSGTISTVRVTVTR